MYDRFLSAMHLIGRTLPSVRSFVFMLGFCCLFVGLWWERPALALVVCGGLLVSISIAAVFISRGTK